MIKAINTAAVRPFARNVAPAAVVHRDCRRGEVKRDVVSVLAAFDEQRSLSDRQGDMLVDRLCRVLGN